MPASAPAPRCSFCGKPQHDALVLLAARHAYICDACVSDCNATLAADYAEVWPWRHLPPAPARPFPAPLAGRAAVAFTLTAPAADTTERSACLAR